jgi:hypothetical protein
MKKAIRTAIQILLSFILGTNCVLHLCLPVNAIAKDLADKPYMGWSSYSLQVYDSSVPWISEAEIKKQSDAMKKYLSDYGYEYINIDAGWNDGNDQWGRPLPSTQRYPNGFVNLVNHVHANGQKLGIYSIPGMDRQLASTNFEIYGTRAKYGRPIYGRDILAKDANGNYIIMDYWDSFTYKIDFSKPGAQEYIDSIVDQFASWGVDFLKFDSVMPGSDKGDSRSSIDDVIAFSMACERNSIWLEISWAVDRNYADIWKQYANGWRIEHDVEAYRSIQDYGADARMVNWENIERLFPMQAKWWDVAGPGGWSDFDSLNVGNGSMNGLTEDERKLAATFWAISSAQFYVGDDLTRLDAYGLSLLTNSEVIAVNQAGHPARPVDNSYQVWYANNGDGTFNVALFNLDSQAKDITVNWRDIGIAGSAQVRDLWAGANLGAFSESFLVQLNSHAAALYKVTVENGSWMANNTDTDIQYTGNWNRDGGKQLAEVSQNFTLEVIDSSQPNNGGIFPSATVFSGSATGATVNLMGGAISNITDGDYTLVQGKDYTISGNQFTISADYLNGKKADKAELNVSISGAGQQTETVFANDTDSGIIYYRTEGEWDYNSNRIFPDHNGDVHFSERAGDYLTYTFTGTGISFLTETNDGNADFEIYLDGALQQGTFTSNAEGMGRECQVAAYTTSGLAHGEHTIKIVNLSEGKFLHVDAFVVEDTRNAQTTIVNDTDASIKYYKMTRGWGYSENRAFPDYFGDVHYSENDGDYLSYSFTGTGVSFLTETNDNNADFEVYLNGVRQPGIFTSNAEGMGRECQIAAYTVSGLAYGEHTIEIVNLSDSRFLHMDAFAVEKPRDAETTLTIHLAGESRYVMVNDSDSEIKYSGRWGYSANRGLGDFNDDLHYGEDLGDSVTYSFTGTGIAYIAEKLNEVGAFEVYIDGVSQGTHSAYANVGGNDRETLQTLYEITGLNNGRHTIKIVKTDNAPYLQVDAFRVEKPSLIMPGAAVYDKNAPGTVSFSLQGNEDRFANISDSQGELSGQTDYTLSNNAINFSSAYLNGLTTGRHTLEVGFSGDFCGDLHWTDDDGAAFSYAFSGSNVELIGPKGPEYGNIDIYVDGVFHGTASAYSASRLAQQSIYAINGISAGAHTIKGIKSGGTVIAFDALAFRL